MEETPNDAAQQGAGNAKSSATLALLKRIRKDEDEEENIFDRLGGSEDEKEEEEYIPIKKRRHVIAVSIQISTDLPRAFLFTHTTFCPILHVSRFPTSNSPPPSLMYIPTTTHTQGNGADGEARASRTRHTSAKGGGNEKATTVTERVPFGRGGKGAIFLLFF